MRLPVSFFRSIFPAARLPGLKPWLEATGSVTAALAGEGVTDFTRQRTEITAERASPLLARQLQVPEGAPLLRSDAVNIDPQGRPVEQGRAWFVADRVTLVFGES